MKMETPTEFRPRFEYLEWSFFIIILILFFIFGKLNLINLISLFIFFIVISVHLISISNALIISENEIIIKRSFLRYSKEIRRIRLNELKSITLMNPARLRGIKVTFKDNKTKTFICNIKKSDLRVFGEIIKENTSLEVFTEGYFKTNRL